MDYIKLVRDIIEPLVSNPDALDIKIKEDSDKKFAQITVYCSNDDAGKLIGRGGSVADAIREIVNVSGKLSNKRVHVKFESRN